MLFEKEETVKVPKFIIQSPFAEELKAKVEAYLAIQFRHRFAPIRTWLKALFFLTVTLSQYCFLVFRSHSPISAVLQSILLGILISEVGLNVMHEAAHRNFSKKPWLNRLLALSMDCAGVSASLYRIKHTVFHHSYTNIDGVDGDISEAPVIRMSTRQPWKGFHRFQWIYSIPLYSLLTITWIFIDDYFRMWNGKIGSAAFVKPRGKKLLGLIALKLLHLVIGFVIPSLFHPWRSVLGCYLIVQFTLGLILALVFQVAHLFEGTEFPENEAPLPMKENWLIHQLKTTADFGTENRFLTFCLGGLNFQVEHHLFPNVSYAHYPAIQKIVKETCVKHGIPYNEFSTFRGAIMSHVQLLKRLGEDPSETKEEISRPLRWLRNIWRGMHVSYSMLFLLFRKGDYRVIYTIYRYVMNHPSYRISLALLKQQSDFMELVESRYNPTGEVDFEKLRNLPKGTLGREFADFMNRPMITQVAELPAAHQKINPEIDYIRLRLRLTHDIHHVLTGFPGTEMGEMGISAFYVAQVCSPLNSMLLAAGLIKCTIKAPHRLHEFIETIIEGWEIGKRAQGVFGAKYEEVFEVPLPLLQERFLRGKPSKMQWTLIEEPL